MLFLNVQDMLCDKWLTQKGDRLVNCRMRQAHVDGEWNGKREAEWNKRIVEGIVN